MSKKNKKKHVTCDMWHVTRVYRTARATPGPLNKLFKKSHYFKAKLSMFFKILISYFEKFFSTFYVFCAKFKDGTQKSYWKPNTSALFLHHKFFKFLLIFGFFPLCVLVSNIFTIFFSGSEVWLIRCDSYSIFGY